MNNSVIIAMAALLVPTAFPAIAQDAQKQASCSIIAKTCLNKADILQHRIRMLNAEIKKGKRNFSAEEMSKFEKKLQEAQDQLDKVEANPPQKY